MVGYSSSAVNPIFKGSVQPSAVDYSLWINPDTNESFFSDGTKWTELPSGGSATDSVIIDNALDILELQATATLTGGTSANMIRDIYTDANGYLNTIDTATTTSSFLTNKYFNILSDEASGDTTSDPNTFTNASNAFDGNDATTASKTIGTASASLGKTFDAKMINKAKIKCSFEKGSGTGGAFDIKLQTYDGAVWTDKYTIYDAGLVFSAMTETIFTIPLQNIETNCQGIRILFTNGSPTNVICKLYTLAYGSTINTIVQTNMQTLESTPSKAIVFSWRDEVTGTGSITADVSFDNGTNYKTMNLNTEYSIDDIGTELILKLNLNAGASSGTAETKGYGVLFW
jgi:hypothetical protein